MLTAFCSDWKNWVSVSGRRQTGSERGRPAEESYSHCRDRHFQCGHGTRLEPEVMQHARRKRFQKPDFGLTWRTELRRASDFPVNHHFPRSHLSGRLRVRCFRERATAVSVFLMLLRVRPVWRDGEGRRRRSSGNERGLGRDGTLTDPGEFASAFLATPTRLTMNN